jgi:hypothetical protein
MFWYVAEYQEAEKRNQNLNAYILPSFRGLFFLKPPPQVGVVYNWQILERQILLQISRHSGCCL